MKMSTKARYFASAMARGGGSNWTVLIYLDHRRSKKFKLVIQDIITTTLLTAMRVAQTASQVGAAKTVTMSLDRSSDTIATDTMDATGIAEEIDTTELYLLPIKAMSN